MITKTEFIEWLKNNRARFDDATEKYKGQDTIYVYSKDEYDAKKAHPRKYKDLFVPYIRVSWHENSPEVLYTRWNGVCRYMTEDCIKSIIVNGI